MKTTILIICLLFTSSFANAQTGYPYIIQNISWNNTPAVLKNFTGDIISPYDDAQPVTVDGTADVEFHGGYSVTLNPGFTASATTGAFNFRAVIDEEIESVVITPDPSTSIDANGNIHVNKWEKLEIGFTLPQKYQAAVNNFFNHYFPPGNGNPSSDYDLNPYADDSLLIRIDLTSPSNQIITKWGFFMREARWGADVVQGYPGSAFLEEDVNDVNYKYFYRLRFAPDVVSTQPWSLSINLSAPNTKDAATDPLLDFNFPGFTFICDAPLPDNHGYVKVNANNNRYLKFEDGTPFFPMGENLMDSRHGLAGLSNPAIKEWRFYKFDFENYKRTIDELTGAGGNFFRFLHFINTCALEFSHIGVYDTDKWDYACFSPDPPNTEFEYNHQWQAWMFDQLLNYAHEKKTYIQLYVDPNEPGIGYESFGWGNYCYLSKFCDYWQDNINAGHYNNTFQPDKFFCDLTNLDITDPSTALYWHARKYKYLLSRWGYSTNIAMLEPFSELDIKIEYANYDLTNTVSICPSHRINWPANQDMKDAQEAWYNVMLDHIKKPVTLGGLGEGKRLFQSSYGVNALWVHSSGSNPVTSVENAALIDYHAVFDDPNFDILDNHPYEFFNFSSGTKWRFNAYSGDLEPYLNTVADNLRVSFNKPMRHGEIGHFGNIPSGPSAGTPTYEFFNNYDVSFHNELWSTTMSGFLGAGSTWFTNVVHRWKDGNPNPPGGSANEIGEPFTFFVSPVNGGQPVAIPSTNDDDKIKPIYHNFKPLSDFISLLNSYNFFDQNIIPHMYYDFDTPNNERIESYYLVSDDQQMASGWIHNINKYWANSYIFMDQYSTTPIENYYGCEREGLNNPPATTFPLDGFQPNTNYWVEFYHTRWGSTPLPTSYGLISDGNGTITIDLTSAPLACDSFNADYAFIATILPSPQRKANQQEEKTNDLIQSLNFSIYPNPSIREVRMAIPIDESSELTIQDVTGRIVSKITAAYQNNLLVDLSAYSKGLYLVKLKNSHGEKVKRLIIH